MIIFIEVRSLAGTSYIRAREVQAVQYSEPQKCLVVLAGGATMPCAEPASAVRARVEAALTDNSEMSHGDASL